MKCCISIAMLLMLTGQQALAEEAPSPLLKVIKSQVHYQLNADGSYLKTEDQIIQPLTKDGVEIVASDSLGFSSQREQYTEISAYTQKSDGRRLPVMPDKVLLRKIRRHRAHHNFLIINTVRLLIPMWKSEIWWSCIQR